MGGLSHVNHGEDIVTSRLSIYAIAVTVAVAVSAVRVPPANVQASTDSAPRILLSASTAPVAVLAGAPSVPKGTGPVRNGTFLTFQLADRLDAQVNVGSGNLLVRSTDLILPGVATDLTLGAAYNSLLVGSGLENGALGHGWRTRAGVDVRLFPADDGSVTYAAADGVVGVFTPSGTGYASPGEFKATLARDGAGWKLTEHNSGRALSFTSAGLLDNTTDRNGNVTDVVYGSGEQQSRIVSDRGPSVVRNGNTGYGGNGFIASLNQSGTDGTSRTTLYGYDAAGNLSSITDPLGNVFTFGYDGAHNLTSITNPTTETPARTTITYDGQHRATSVTRLIGPKSNQVATTRFAYVSSTQTQVADANTDPSQPVGSVPHTTYTVNADKRVSDTTDPAGNTRSRTYTFFFDVATTTSAEGGTITNTYGANGGESPTQSTAPTGATGSLAYANPVTPANPTANFQPSSGVDSQGNASLLTYSGAGNIASITDATAAKASVDYNDDGTVKSSTDPANGTNSTTYAYDTDKQLRTITPPTGNSLGVRTYTYDAYGRLRTASDGANRTSTFGYDTDDRVSSISYSDATPTVTYTHDGSGYLTKRVDGVGTTAYTYDKAGRLLTVGNTANGKTLSYKYDAVGNLTVLSDGRGSTTYSYDTRNLLTSTVNSDATRYTFNYDKDGRRTNTYFNTVVGNATWTTRTVTTYDKSGRVTRITAARNTNPTDRIFDVSYCYAPFVSGQPCSTTASSDSGLRRWQRDEITGTISVYSHDAANRLTQASNVAGHSYGYTYDADGNRKTVTVDGTTTQSLSFNSGNQITDNGYGYDGAGNLTAAPGATYTYDAAEQMTSATVSGTTSPHAYAGADQTEMISAAGNQFVYGRDGQYHQAWLQSYNHGAAQAYVERDGRGTPLGLRSAANDYTTILDGLGSVVAIVAQDGTIAARYTYDPYGAATSVSETGLNQPNVVRFAGGVQDETTGLTKFGRRFYDPNLGRFTQQDDLNTIGDPSKGNRYAYAGCNPTNNIDPTGLQGGGFGGWDCGYAVAGTVLSFALFEAGVFTAETGIGALVAVGSFFAFLFAARAMIDLCPWARWNPFD
jgi:RHS repeat-associated protein